jgi:hypothetical protein
MEKIKIILIVAIYGNSGIIKKIICQGNRMDKNEILKSIMEINSSFVVSSTGLNRFKQHITELTGIEFEFCDLAFTGNGKEYILKSSDDVLRTSIKNNTLIITSDNKGKEIYTFNLQYPAQ